jgi:hypothetical protein
MKFGEIQVAFFKMDFKISLSHMEKLISDILQLLKKQFLKRHGFIFEALKLQSLKLNR